MASSGLIALLGEALGLTLDRDQQLDPGRDLVRAFDGFGLRQCQVDDLVDGDRCGLGELVGVSSSDVARRVTEADQLFDRDTVSTASRRGEARRRSGELNFEG